MATMDDIQAVERLMQTLDENPHLMEAVRSRLLTRELLELPQTMARLTERVDQLTERMDQLTMRVEQITEQLAQLADRMDRRFDQVANDFTRLKDIGAVTSTKEQTHVIAEVVGLRSQRYLRGNEIIDLSRDQDTSDITPGDLISFHRADLIMEAANDAGETHYIAVEVSFTADSRDTRRAIRNAGYLTRFTGRPAHAVVAGYRKDHNIQRDIDSGRTLWYQLEDDDPD